MTKREQNRAYLDAAGYALTRGARAATSHLFALWYGQQAPTYDALPPLPAAWLIFTCETAARISAD